MRPERPVWQRSDRVQVLPSCSGSLFLAFTPSRRVAHRLSVSGCFLAAEDSLAYETPLLAASENHERLSPSIIRCRRRWFDLLSLGHICMFRLQMLAKSADDLD